MSLTYSYFLGLRTLTVISDAEKMIRKVTPEFSIETISYDDPAVFQMLNAGETEGVFQMESSGMTQAIVGLKAKSIEDIIAIISLYRPGPMESIPTYIANRHDPSNIRYKTPQLAHILDVTNGCIVYQEQVMQICRELAGFSYGQADLVRRAMAKKKHDVMEKERQHFVYGNDTPGQECKGCVANGISEQVANEIFDEMSSFASYAFNKSHAAAYAVVAYQTAFLKCHYPREFMAALLTSVLDNTDKVIEYTTECQRMNLRVLQPDVNASDIGFTVVDGDIRFGLLALKNVGRNLIASVVREREEHPYRSLYDFCKRMHGTELNRRAVESMIKAGAFDSIEPNRHMLVNNLEGILKSIETVSRKNLEGQLDLFSGFSAEEAAAADDYRMQPCEEYSPDIRLQYEKEVSGLYLSGHPLDKYEEEIRRLSECRISDLTGENGRDYDNRMLRLVCTVVRAKTITTKSGGLMAFVTIEDRSGTMELLVFPKTLTDCAEAIRDNEVVVVTGRASCKEDEQTKLIAETVTPIALYSPERAGRPKPAASRNAGLWLRMDSPDGEAYDEVKNLLSIFEGEMPVYIKFDSTGQRVRAPRNLWCIPNELLLRELERILGKGNVVLKQ